MWTVFNNPSAANPKSTREALTNVESRLVVSPAGHNVIQRYSENWIDQDFIKRFNRGDSIYPSGIPFCAFLMGSDSKYDIVRGNEIVNFLPEENDKSLRIRLKRTNMTKPIHEVFGENYRTRLQIEDVEMWMLYHGLLDILHGKGIVALDQDSRVPSRKQYLWPLQDEYQTDDFLSMSREDQEIEHRLGFGSKLQPVKSLVSVMDHWVDEFSDSIYSIKFIGVNLVIDRHVDFKIAAYLASRENHPFLETLKRYNLV